MGKGLAAEMSQHQAVLEEHFLFLLKKLFHLVTVLS